VAFPRRGVVCDTDRSGFARARERTMRGEEGATADG
jgi:hypothetical protein